MFTYIYINSYIKNFLAKTFSTK